MNKIKMLRTTKIETGLRSVLF